MTGSLAVAAPVCAAALVVASCSSPKPAAHSGTTAVPGSTTTASTAVSGSSTSTPAAGQAFPAVIRAAMAKVGSTQPPLLAPRSVPIPVSAPFRNLAASVTTSPSAWHVDLSVTPSPVPVNDPSLASAPDAPGGPNYLGSFGVTQTAAAAATSALTAEAQQLDATCRSQMSPVTLGTGITGQSCANGTGYTIVWSEGNWHLAVVASNSLGPADTQLANLIVDFLHTNMLPAPSSVGVIKATANGGPNATNPSSTIPGSASTSVDIQWTNGPNTIDFSDALDALGGLQMAVSEASY